MLAVHAAVRQAIQHIGLFGHLDKRLFYEVPGYVADKRVKDIDIAAKGASRRLPDPQDTAAIDSVPSLSRESNKNDFSRVWRMIEKNMTVKVSFSDQKRLAGLTKGRKMAKVYRLRRGG